MFLLLKIVSVFSTEIRAWSLRLEDSWMYKVLHEGSFGMFLHDGADLMGISPYRIFCALQRMEREIHPSRVIMWS